ncbi:electron transfer flavoprotein subunit alpha/FixB family protein [Methyloceanibacter caenitepidi]|uniref:Electron transfer flavoprotein, alpha subunit n=1 Tax=Methyloceanibacter caenitepidi TaxID=1384459 RepID=A0A0A8K563_9HYPH|nr:electron transfer flavoprotein subunit alpha/FixB family protein [Methyloceanibacter caenitepidi]BAQ18093.1 electron transfer flavoprotein, alpha subunit [Methyloceanibacter caenitepidi]
MGEILVIAEHRQGQLNPATLEIIAAAVALKEESEHKVTVAVFAQSPDDFAGLVAKAGVDEVVKVPVPVASFQNDTYEAAVLALADARKPAVIMCPHTVDAWGYAPAVAARGQFGCATDVFEMRFEAEGLVAVRAAYAEKLHMEIDFPGKETVLLTVRTNVFKPSEEDGAPAVTSFEAPSAEARTEHLTYVEPEQTGDVDITQAEYMLSIGRGVGEEDNVEEFKELADAFGFTLGCSRPIADNGWLPKSRQVGQSGKTVAKCKVYLALGISGSVQHMAGMKHVPNIIAVNKDAEASIFTIAKYGIVGDMFEIAEELRDQAS